MLIISETGVTPGRSLDSVSNGFITDKKKKTFGVACLLGGWLSHISDLSATKLNCYNFIRDAPRLQAK